MSLKEVLIDELRDLYSAAAAYQGHAQGGKGR